MLPEKTLCTKEKATPIPRPTATAFIIRAFPSKIKRLP